MTLSMSRAAVAMILFVIGQAPASAEVRILASPGGEAGAYLKLFEGLNRSGERVVIDGPCFSACTLVLTAIPLDRVCATRRAVLGFHAPQLWAAGRWRHWFSAAASSAFTPGTLALLCRRSRPESAASCPMRQADTRPPWRSGRD
jgi:hypothetical protein